MTTFLLIRHAHVEAVGHVLAGRHSGHPLSAQGQEEARQLARWLKEQRIDHIVSSPLDRAHQTARILAGSQGLDVQTADALNEFDFGEWAGRSFAELDPDPQWQAFNQIRSQVRPPGGESMLEVQTRAVGFLQRLRKESPRATIALISHCDVIRAVLCYYLGMPLDFYHRLVIVPASVSAFRLEPAGCTFLGINTTPDGA